MKKLHFVSRNWRRENNTVACESSPIKIHYFDYPRRFINRINEVYDFSIKYRYKKLNFIYNHLLCCNHTCYYVDMIYMTSASRYVKSASRYQSRSPMYILGLIQRNSTELAKAVSIELEMETCLSL